MTPAFDSEQDLRILRYLLGDIGEEEALVFEEQYFCEPALLEQVGMVEDRLIRSYLNHTLTPDRLSLFERKYLEVPELRKRIEFAKLLQTKRDAPILQEDPGTSGKESISRLSKIRSAIALTGMAAALVLTLWLARENMRLKAEAARLEAAKSTRTSEHQQPALRQSGGMQILAWVLEPGLQKGGAPSEARQFVLPPEFKEVRINLELPGLVEDPLVRIKVMLVGTQSRRTVLTYDRLRTTATTTGRTVLLVVRPEELTSGDYLIFVQRMDAPADDNTLESYSLSIAKP